jgi:hypothetical protein
MQTAGFVLSGRQNTKIINVKKQIAVYGNVHRRIYDSSPVSSPTSTNTGFKISRQILCHRLRNPGADLTTILESLDDNINDTARFYRCMMSASNMPGQSTKLPAHPKFAFFKKIKLYKLYFHVKNYFQSLKSIQERITSDIDFQRQYDQMLSQAESPVSKRRLDASIKILKYILKTHPDNEKAYITLRKYIFTMCANSRIIGYEWL